MKKTLAGIIEAGEPLIQQAIDAQRRYQAAVDAGQPGEEIERLRLEAESLYQAVTEYQLRSLGGPARTLH
ncbi:hypothetical protein HFV04_021285 [Pseudomonas sp. BIGb0427]|uniref:hypothetical protein n=1 Tax=unclassified Pseudomonas TaxID=196821 RepID=UPI0016B48104|nr:MULTISPECIES: hypothetical protein [unclassified Pseudomonas]NLU60408.1 hypothetical protein [Pseudomonas sp. BIGb0427]QPG62039.1 hypothetical protein HFV04_021285 [Pseudomonas sp. BIGb0427]UVL53923.1 hypothetical protein LOY22_13595 [Pseudomonas sp. B21-035]UVL59178.1 hypothetical protein LOY54_14020 [Pseudomonas sp. B21-032]UVM64396.1 hypothetical protein LOY34_13635 [Pseudomonas sp. B21-009]